MAPAAAPEAVDPLVDGVMVVDCTKSVPGVREAPEQVGLWATGVLASGAGLAASFAGLRSTGIGAVATAAAPEAVDPLVVGVMVDIGCTNSLPGVREAPGGLGLWATGVVALGAGLPASLAGLCATGIGSCVRCGVLFADAAGSLVRSTTPGEPTGPLDVPAVVLASGD